MNIRSKLNSEAMLFVAVLSVLNCSSGCYARMGDYEYIGRALEARRNLAIFVLSVNFDNLFYPSFNPIFFVKLGKITS